MRITRKYENLISLGLALSLVAGISPRQVTAVTTPANYVAPFYNVDSGILSDFVPYLGPSNSYQFGTDGTLYVYNSAPVKVSPNYSYITAKEFTGTTPSTTCGNIPMRAPVLSNSGGFYLDYKVQKRDSANHTYYVWVHCALTSIPLPDTSNTVIFQRSGHSYKEATYTYDSTPFPYLEEYDKKIDVKYLDSGNASDAAYISQYMAQYPTSTVDKLIKVSAIVDNLKEDTYALRFKQSGIVTREISGDARSSFSSAATPNLFYDSSKNITYLIRWTTTYTPQVINLSSSLKNASSLLLPYVIRPLNSDIIFATQPKCTINSSGNGILDWTITTTYACTTYGLAADGRIGTANLVRSQTAGNFSITFTIVAAAAVAYFTGDAFINDFTFAAAGGTAAPLTGVEGVTLGASANAEINAINTSNPNLSFVTGLPASDIASAIAEAGITPPVLGTVENSDNLGVGKWTWSPAPPACSFSSNPSTIPGGQQSTLSWNCTNANLCSIDNGVGVVSSTQGTANVSPSATTNYTLSCSGPAGSNSFGTTITVAPALSCTFSASPSPIVEGQQSTLSWNCSNADSCSIDNGIGSVSNANGTKSVSPAQNTDYNLSCIGSGGSQTLKSSVTVYENPVCTLTISPQIVVPPQEATLSWECAKAVSCSIDNGIGSVSATGGSKIVRPDKDTNYTLSCNGQGDSQAQAKASFQTSIKATTFQIKEVAP